MLRGYRSFLLALVVLLLIVGLVGGYFATQINRPASDPGAAQQIFSIDTGESVPDVATALEQDHVIRSSFMFRVLLKMKSAEDQIKAGDFELSPSMTPEEIIGLITQAPANNLGRVTIPEGYRVEQIADMLADQGLVDRDRFLTVVVTGTFAYDWLPQQRTSAGDIEGFLFPDTYDFPRTGDNREERIVDAMLKNFATKVGPDLRAQATGTGYTLRQVLTIASIVEREAQQDDERPIIAGVFYNRLTAGMQLQADPTTQYALGKTGDWWPQLTVDPNTVDSPYNTYEIAGLPPGPIANPGLASIKAAISPAQTDFYYFFACGNAGHHNFAQTLEEHEQNIANCK